MHSALAFFKHRENNEAVNSLRHVRIISVLTKIINRGYCFNKCTCTCITTTCMYMYYKKDSRKSIKESSLESFIHVSLWINGEIFGVSRVNPWELLIDIIFISLLIDKTENNNTFSVNKKYSLSKLPIRTQSFYLLCYIFVLCSL